MSVAESLSSGMGVLGSKFDLDVKGLVNLQKHFLTKSY